MIMFAYSVVHEQYQWHYQSSGPEALTVIHLVLMSSQGLVAFLIFGARKQNYLYWRESLTGLRRQLNRRTYEFEYQTVQSV